MQQLLRFVNIQNRRSALLHYNLQTLFNKTDNAFPKFPILGRKTCFLTYFTRLNT